MCSGRTSFTAHNIRLDDGTETKPELGYLLADEYRLMATKRLLCMLYPAGLKGVRIADLGCLEGGFAVEFARMGMDAVGVEVRESNFRNCLYVKEHLNLPNLSFVHDDAWNLGKYGTFDVIFCCGLLYHIEHPVAFLQTLSDLCGKALIVNTHFATDKTQYGEYKLGEMTEHEGVQGRWLYEYDPNEVAEANYLDLMKWASWTNHRSFWIRREYIFDALRRAGFNLILEQFDCLPDPISEHLIHGYYATEDRGTFMGVKV